MKCVAQKELLNRTNLGYHPIHQITNKGRNMADRKQFLNSKPADPELVRALEASRDKPVTEEELHEQRISFAFGNAPESSKLITKESVRRASKKISILT